MNRSVCKADCLLFVAACVLVVMSMIILLFHNELFGVSYGNPSDLSPDDLRHKIEMTH